MMNHLDLSHFLKVKKGGMVWSVSVKFAESSLFSVICEIGEWMMRKKKEIIQKWLRWL